MQVRRISSFTDLESQRLAWNCLSRGVPFRSWEWNQSWWKYYGNGRELLLLAVYDDRDQLIGIAPWFVEQSALRVRSIHFLGTGDVCSDYLSLLTTTEHEDAVVEAVADWLFAANADRTNEKDLWDLLQLAGVSHTDSAIAKLAERLRNTGNVVFQREEAKCWRLSLPGTWEEYEGLLSKSHRKQIRRVDRRLLETGRAVLKTVATEDELARGLQILVDLHQKRRQRLEQGGCFARPYFPEFLFDVAKEMLRCERLQLHWVELDGRPVACEFHLEGNQVTYAYQAGIDPDVIDEEPGRMINIATLKRAIKNGQTAFDFLRGDEPYKAHWRAEPEPLLELRIVARRGVSQMWAGMWLAKNTMKNWLKTGLNLAGMR